MITRILCILAVMLCFASCSQEQSVQQNLAQEVQSRYALVLTDSGWGSAVIADTGFVLSAGHVMYGHGSIIVVNKEFADSAKVIDFADDQVLVKVARLNAPTISTVNEVVLGQMVCWIQPSMLENQKFHVYFNSGRVNRVFENHFSINAPMLPGASGGGVFDMSGNLVGIIESYIAFDGQVVYGVAAEGAAYEKLLGEMTMLKQEKSIENAVDTSKDNRR